MFCEALSWAATRLVTFLAGALCAFWAVASSGNEAYLNSWSVTLGTIGALGTIVVLIELVLRWAADRPALQALAGAILVACLATASLTWRCAGLHTVWAILPMALACEHGRQCACPVLHCMALVPAGHRWWFTLSRVHFQVCYHTPALVIHAARCCRCGMCAAWATCGGFTVQGGLNGYSGIPR